MLHAHPRIAIPPETRFLLPIYFGRRDFGDLREAENRRALARFIVRRKKGRFVDLGLKRKQIVNEIVAGPPTVGSAVGIVLRAYARQFGKPRWGDKRPGYHHYIPTLLRMFPDAQIIHQVRDGRDCVASLKRMPWWKNDTYAAVSTWTEAIDHVRAAIRSLPPGTIHEVRYERLVGDPATELAALCAFLGEEYDEAMLEPKRLAGVAVPPRKKWHAATHEDVSVSAVGNWQRVLEPWEVRLCETVMAGRLQAYGYELSGAPRASAVDLLRYTERNARRRLIRRRHLAVDWARRLAEDRPVASMLTAADRKAC